MKQFEIQVLWLLLMKFVMSSPLALSSSSSPNSVRRNDIMLDLMKLSSMGDPDQILSALKQVARALHGCQVREVPSLKRAFLSNKTVTCNDGSPAGYYIRKSFGSKKWIVFLEGGWYCFDELSCHGRWRNMRHYMSSKLWPGHRKGTGILSWDPEENPYYFAANMVFVPYCTSDSWSGTIRAEHRGQFSFMGSLVVEEVIKDLLWQGLASASKLILAGSSAGGVGVLMNLDRVGSLMGELAPGVEVKGVVDSGWFLDNDQFKPVPCVEAHSCAPTEGIKKGIRLWQSRVPENCAILYPDEQWRCYFGYRMYPTLKTPVYITQYLFDEAQITADNVGPPVKKEQWQYIHKMGKEMKASLQNVTAVFAPACLSHILLTKIDWHKISVDGVTLPQALHCWETASDSTTVIEECPFSRRRHKSAKQRSLVDLSGSGSENMDSLLADDPSASRARRRHKRRHRRRRNRRRKRKRGKNKTKRPKRALGPWRTRKQNCKRHLIDSCAWPQCNFSCPKLRNPFTGDEMDFIDLLMQFGLDVSSIANALGMDTETLQSMDHDDLMKMLTEQT